MLTGSFFDAIIQHCSVDHIASWMMLCCLSQHELQGNRHWLIVVVGEEKAGELGSRGSGMEGKGFSHRSSDADARFFSIMAGTDVK